jgi:hypothetical protein
VLDQWQRLVPRKGREEEGVPGLCGSKGDQQASQCQFGRGKKLNKTLVSNEDKGFI